MKEFNWKYCFRSFSNDDEQVEFKIELDCSSQISGRNPAVTISKNKQLMFYERMSTRDMTVITTGLLRAIDIHSANVKEFLAQKNEEQAKKEERIAAIKSAITAVTALWNNNGINDKKVLEEMLEEELKK